MNVSLFTDVSHVSTPPSKIPVEVILGSISSGEGGLDLLIQKIRETAPENRRPLKKQLGSIVFSGYCGKAIEKVNKTKGNKYLSYREDKSLTEHSGLCVVDLDHLGTSEDVAEWKEKFAELDTVFAAFVSPSGDGLKVVFKIPANIGKHRGHYRALINGIRAEFPELTSKNLDSTSINESRLCFISYDPDIYINEMSSEWTEYQELEETGEVDNATITMGSGLTDYDKLQTAAKMIDHAKDGYKHTTLVKASYLMGGFITSGHVDEEEARQMLRTRIAAKNPTDLHGAYKTIDDGLREGKKKPIYEIEKIEQEFEIEISRKKYKDENRGYTFLIDRNETDEKMMDYIINGATMGLPVGLKELDDYFRFKENNFSVFLGHDNVGKSTLVWWLTVVSAIKYGWKWIIYSPENDIPKIKKNLIDFVLGRNSQEAKSMKQIEMAKALIDKHFYFIRKDEIYDVFQVLEFGRVLCDADPEIKGFMIDPYNSLSLDYKGKGKGLSAYEYHMRAISEMRVFAEKYCTIYVNAHSNTDSRRAGKPDEEGYTTRPYKSEIDGGAMWANRVDDFYAIHRHIKHAIDWNLTELHIDKIKDYDTGGQITRGDDAPKLKFWNKADFVGSDEVSPLKEWRMYFFGEGKQTHLETLMTIPDEDEDENDVPF